MYQPPNNQQPNTYYPPQQPQQWQQPPYGPYPPQGPMMPPQAPPPPKKKRSPWLIIGLLIGALIVCGAIGAALSAKPQSSPQSSTTSTVAATTGATDTPAATDTPMPTPKPLKWMTVQSYSGTGDKQTGVIAVPDDWKILWSCDATHNYGVAGAFVVEVYNSDGTLSNAGDVNTMCAANKVTNDSTEEHGSGNVYLKILASIPWTIQVEELK